MSRLDRDDDLGANAVDDGPAFWNTDALLAVGRLDVREDWVFFNGKQEVFYFSDTSQRRLNTSRLGRLWTP